MTKFQLQMKQLQMQVIDDCYYENIYNSCLKKHEMSRIGVRDYSYSDAKIVDLANDFWLDLPDSIAIRTGPFWLLCELCEASPSDIASSDAIAEHCFDEEE